MKPTVKKTSIWLCEETKVEHGGFAFTRKRLGAAAGAQNLGASWFELQPGKKAFPFHYHLANEEALYVLEGEGVLRLGDEEHNLRPGDFVTFTPGPPAHQIINRSNAPLRYLTVSTMIEPEVAIYPDSNKIGVLARAHNVVSVHKRDATVDYYEGED